MNDNTLLIGLHGATSVAMQHVSDSLVASSPAPVVQVSVMRPVYTMINNLMTNAGVFWSSPRTELGAHDPYLQIANSSLSQLASNLRAALVLENPAALMEATAAGIKTACGDTTPSCAILHDLRSNAEAQWVREHGGIVVRIAQSGASVPAAQYIKTLSDDILYSYPDNLSYLRKSTDILLGRIRKRRAQIRGEMAPTTT